MINRLIFLLVFLVLYILSSCEHCQCLLSLITIYRHGARSPIRLYKNDPYINMSKELWPEGLGQLTNLGKMQQYQLGQWLRSNYKHFIPENYDRSFIQVHSSNKDRCLMSAATNLAGLFPPKRDQIWNKKLQWQPAPIHTLPESQDAILAIGKPCPRFAKLLEDFMRNFPLHQNFLHETQHMQEYIEKNVGAEMSLDDLKSFHDTLFVERSMGLTLPKWTHKVFPERTIQYITYSFVLPTYTPQLARLMAGPLINKITDFFENVLADPANNPKYLMLSAHDKTMIYLLNALEIYDNVWVEYASAINFELYSCREKTFINVKFKNSTGHISLTIKHCENDCEFERFKKITTHLRINPQAWSNECHNG
ncbi:unnamed protein product [Phyllotreta striolata]|uniref:acid phosphatase n=1 Tax=Phyllotreta striolata TaxID=444603 RepID=A0A9N9XNM9_PHYSR|nr:unnamed protein product [Phyllotreta striolata]